MALERALARDDAIVDEQARLLVAHKHRLKSYSELIEQAHLYRVGTERC